jgi:hypothetical protein
MENQDNKKRTFGNLKFDSIKLWTSRNGKLFYRIQVGKNSLFIAENLLVAIKNQKKESA